MNDKELGWIVRRWKEANTERDWQSITRILHGAWMAVINYSADDADVYDTLYYIACERQNELLKASFKREAA